VWGSASSDAHSHSEAGTHTDLAAAAAATTEQATSDEGESSSEAATTLSSELGGTQPAAAAGWGDEAVTAAAGAAAVPITQHQQQQQQQVEAATALSSAQSWLSVRLRAAGSAVLRTLGRALGDGLGAVSSRLSLQLHLPPPALQRVVVSQGQLDVQVCLSAGAAGGERRRRGEGWLCCFFKEVQRVPLCLFRSACLCQTMFELYLPSCTYKNRFHAAHPARACLMHPQVWGEPIMRCVRDVGVLVTLGPDYSWLEVQVEGDAEPRHPASVKCTSINPAAKRHLRHVTPGSSSSTRLRRFACDVLPEPPPSAAAAGGGVEQQQQAVLAVEGAGGGVVASAPAASSDSALEKQQQQHVEVSAADSSREGSSSHSSSDSHQPSSPTPSSAAAAHKELEGPSVSQASAEATAEAAAVHPSSSSSSSGLPLSTLHLPSGQLGAVQEIHFLQAGELTGGQAGQQQGQGPSGSSSSPGITALLPQKGEAA
jgi:hypothetical protein